MHRFPSRFPRRTISRDDHCSPLPIRSNATSDCRYTFSLAIALSSGFARLLRKRTLHSLVPEPPSLAPMYSALIPCTLR